MLKQSILTNKEKEIIEKKLNNKKITPMDSYYLNKSIRPKLRQMSSINADYLLKKLEYNQKSLAIERKIKKLVLNKIKSVKAVILYGSAIQTNYSEYNDIDVLIVVKKKLWKNQREKYNLIKSLQDNGIKLDMQLITEKDLYLQYPHNPSLIYQLEDKKIIYGRINLPKKIELHNADLKMKMDWSESDAIGLELYKSIRNALLVKLLLNKIVSNEELKNSLKEELGTNLMNNLKNNLETKEERIIARRYLKNLINEVYKELKGDLWERKVQLIV
ncbi:MAG: nucleotidyltransferase domain-containing protein [Nanoarchaeota archaeon]